ncbi:MAG: 4Fe-4S binding protein [Pontibacterium sp.]
MCCSFLSLMRVLCIALTCQLFSHLVHAGVLTKADIEAAFPSPYIVGDQDPNLPIWPLRQQISTDTPLVGYAFESLDMVSVPGFAGIPYNLLVAMDTEGKFLSVKVLSHHEPVFLEGLGEQPLIDFADQYAGLSLMQNIKIDSKPPKTAAANNANAFIDGVAKATASVRILNQTLLASSLTVAREKLGFAKGRDPDLIARIKTDLFYEMTWDELVKEGLITRFVYTNAQGERAFIGTSVEGQDEEAISDPNGTFVELYVANLAVPTVGKNLMPPEAWRYVQENLREHDQLMLVVGKGRYSFVGEEFVRGDAPNRVSLQQAELPIEIRDFDLSDRLDLFELEYQLKLPSHLEDFEWKAFHILAQSGLDPAFPAELALHVNRQKGILFPETVSVTLPLVTQMPKRYYVGAESDNKTWVSLWENRLVDIVILFVGLMVLTGVLARYKLLAGSHRRLRWFRPLYLLYTLVFIGWYAQGQLSIVNITGVLQALDAGRSLEFFLYDPMTVIIWAYTGLTFFVWGRGTFCGWLCPFGALQELIGKVMAFAKLPQINVSLRTDFYLKRIKYFVLLGILGIAFVSVPLTGSVVEVEPFKTSITLMFDRSWPFVLWAVALIVLSLFVYKGYCRYLCPLGASMAVLGKLRLYNWLPRRSECGSPCQLCKNKCEYQAIEPKGKIDYNECFQCLDCVEIYEDDTQCVPLIVEKRNKGRKLKVKQVL